MGRLLLDDIAVPDNIRVSGTEVIKSVRHYLHAGRILRQGGLSRAARAMLPVNASYPERGTRSAATVHVARSTCAKLDGLVRTLVGHRLCLYESVGAASALRTLGFDADVLIGYPLIERRGAIEKLHAWPAIGDTPLTGVSQMSWHNLIPLMRVPEAYL